MSKKYFNFYLKKWVSKTELRRLKNTHQFQTEYANYKHSIIKRTPFSNVCVESLRNALFACQIE